jgi:hypothetical protein
MSIGALRRLAFVGVSLAALVGSSAADAAGIFRAYLSRSGSDSNDCTLPTPCRLLPKALSVTNSGGEIWMLDSANYNTAPVAITQSVTILAVPGARGSIVGNNGDAIQIGTAGIRVTLENVNILQLAGSGNGINMTDGAALNLINSSVFNFTGAGVLVSTGATTSLVSIKDTVIRGNANGLAVSGDARVNVVRSSFVNNSAAGVAVNAGGTFTATVYASDSSASGNQIGFYSVGAASGFASALYVSRCSANDNSVAGFAADGGVTGVIAVSNSTATGNTVGFLNVSNLGIFATYQNNMVIGNGTNTSGTIVPATPL